MSETVELKDCPNPGSREAVEMGCKCPVIDNHHGKGVPMGEDGAPMFWRSANCRLHWTEMGSPISGSKSDE